ncbi:MAG TPA: 7TM diverse intracellular signaling domain-containing protein [Leptospiraceae bacterium]|nr:7TM diverse intracellular signaling domain-containing protein [Leptospiraceae bacterium]HMX31757.1 7TM diverse intracellular signaling domain-containing protein [Leptospiraceae bacterium]HMY30563.1 7TM diverse intracellular signaling domain-containing protein [Leptospiraceae bacterium]HMZ64136.1 7TM diverse intracellular signaling domain-containing protein [Leptospiraceae bacterium]HNA08756.1 7TM diverse intracellular signaling domain-containing protein [Leptospiraceae bacterium]
MKNQFGYATYRLKIILPENSKNHQLSLRLVNLLTASNVYVNDILIYKSGKISKTPENSEAQILPASVNLPQLEKEFLLTIQISNFHQNKGGIYSAPELGSQLAISGRREKQVAIDMLLFGSIIIMGIYHIVLLVIRRKDTSNLFFGIFCILLSTRIAIMGERIFIHWFPKPGYDFYMRLELISYFLAIPSFTLYVKSLYPNLIGKWIAVVSIFFGVLYSLISILTHASIFTNLIFQSSLILIFIGIYIIIAITRAWFKKLQGAKSFLFGFFILFLSSLNDIVNSLTNEFNTGIYIVPVGLLIFIFSQSYLLSVRYSNAFQKIEELSSNLFELNTTLEQKVINRTKELHSTLTEVQNLKEKQDADYFLTSLLIDPLKTHDITGDKVKIEFKIQEKKQFTYQNNTKGIGGDLCLAKTIILKNRSYSLFVNADAMGKSLMGAGGVIVLGSVMKACIERTIQTPTEKLLYPERWLKNIFLELHKIFESFNGYMLTSIVIGLVDEKTGLVYFINAEHPYVILYRSQKAKFIESQIHFSKLGIGNEDSTIWIQTFQMKPNDVILVGSDGKDELLKYDKHGNTSIVSDYKYFLKIVEEANGNIDSIFEILNSKLEQLIDDLSLLRLSYLENNKPQVQTTIIDKIKDDISKGIILFKNKDYINALNVFQDILKHQPENEIVIRYANACAIKMEDFKLALEYGLQLIEIRPDKSFPIFQTSILARRNNQLLLAADLGERYRLRNPKNIKNLFSLIETHSKMGNHSRIEKLLKEIRTINPNHPLLHKF